jgi:hypothetical protein
MRRPPLITGVFYFMEKEEWKHLVEHYEISNLGNVRNKNTLRNLKPLKCNQYKTKVILTLENNSKRKDVYLASEVARKFISESFKKVIRIDKNQFNNRVDNLIVI